MKKLLTKSNQRLFVHDLFNLCLFNAQFSPTGHDAMTENDFD